MEKTHRNRIADKLTFIRVNTFHIQIFDTLFQNFINKELVLRGHIYFPIKQFFVRGIYLFER